MQKKDLKSKLATKKSPSMLWLLVPFVALASMGVFIAKTGERLTKMANSHGSIEMAVMLGVVLAVAVASIPVYWAIKTYRYLQKLCKLGWNDAQGQNFP